MVLHTLPYNAAHSGREGHRSDPDSSTENLKAQATAIRGTRADFFARGLRTFIQRGRCVMTRIHRQFSTTLHTQWTSVKWTALAVYLFTTLVLLASLAMAQSSSQLNGSVSDPSGAAVAGANITVTNTATGTQRTTTSNASGLYQFLDVAPGDYRLEASANGFSKVVVPNVTILVKLPSTVPLRLQVAGQTTSVTVEGEAPLINRTDASLGNVVGEDQIAELPIPQRNVVQLLSLQPGVAYLGGAAEDNKATDTRSGAVNGMRSDQSNVTLDGIGVNDQNFGYAFTSVLNVPPDSVQEFRVTTANSNADSGYSSGAQVALATKSGTNRFHGSAYEYNRNTIFSANDPFLKNSQLTSGQSNTAPKLLYNVFGVTAGGPIKKNRLFFFANYEGKRQAQGTAALRTVPSPSLRAGNLVYLCADRSSCPGGTVNGVTGVQPGYYALGPTQIKAMDPLGIGVNQGVLNTLGQYPVSNENAGDGSNTLGYRFASNADSPWNTYILKGDWHINSSGSETLFVRGQTQNQKDPGEQQFPGQSAATTALDDSKGLTIGLDLATQSQTHQRFSLGIYSAGREDRRSLNDSGGLSGWDRQSRAFREVSTSHHLLRAGESVHRRLELDAEESHVSVRRRFVPDSQRSHQLSKLVLGRADQCGLSEYGWNRRDFQPTRSRQQRLSGGGRELRSELRQCCNDRHGHFPRRRRHL